MAFIPGQHQLDLGIDNLAKVLDRVDIFILNLYEACTLLDEPYLEYENNASSLFHVGKLNFNSPAMR